MFNLKWVQAVVKLFSYFGITMFLVGVAVSAFDLAIEYQNGRASIKGTALNWIKGFMGASLFTVAPIELYKFCISLQNTLAGGLTTLFASTRGTNLGEVALFILQSELDPSIILVRFSLANLLMLIALAYCTVKVFC